MIRFISTGLAKSPAAYLHWSAALLATLAVANTAVYGQTPQGSLQEVGNEVRVTASVIPAGGGAPQNAAWRVEFLRPGVGPGVAANIYLVSNPGSLGGINGIVASQEPAATVVIANPHWSDPGQGLGYPAEFTEGTGQFTGNQEGFFVDHYAEIFIPGDADRNGADEDVVKFKDGVDDYCYLEVDGNLLVDDNTWTGVSGADNGGSPIAPLNVSDPKFDDGEWVSLRFVAAEGGGGDGGVLYWDALDDDGTFPEDPATAADANDLVPDANFRAQSLVAAATESGTGQPVGLVLPTAIADDVAQVRLYVNNVLVQKLAVNTGAPGGTIAQTGTEIKVTAGIFPSDGSAALSADWSLGYYTPGLAPGITADIYLVGNPGSLGSIDAIIESQEPDGSVVIANPHWSEPSRGFGYPQEFRDATGLFPIDATQENFFINHYGEIFIPARADRSDPASDAVRFKDGVDDYCYLEVDGNQLVDDNTWTGQTGADNGGSPIAEFDVSNDKFDDGEWVNIRFVAAEGGGGDSGILYWDALDTDDNFPEVESDAADPLDLIPNGNFRAPGLAKVKEVNGSGTPAEQVVDALPDGVMQLRLFVNETEVKRLDVDRDGDVMPDLFEVANGFDPADPADGALDKDGDALSNAVEYTGGTDPQESDSDGDGLADGAEVNTHNTNPLDADEDTDGLNDGGEIAASTDPKNPDTDGDGVIDGIEVQSGTDPTDPLSFSTALLAYWDFEDSGDDTKAVDLVGGFEAENTGASYANDPDRGSVADFSQGGAFRVADASFLNLAAPSDQVTFVLWQRNDDTVNSSSFWAVSPSSSGSSRGAQAHIPWDSSGTIYFDTAGCCDGTQRGNFVPSIDFLDGEWHHYAFVKDGDNKRIYVDGVLEFSIVNTANLPDDFTELFIGSDSGTASVAGQIDDFAVYAVALDAARIKELAEGAPILGGKKAPFQILRVAHTANKATITWNSKSGKSYSVAYSSDLMDFIEGTDGVESTGNETSYEDASLTPDVKVRYYQVSEE